MKNIKFLLKNYPVPAATAVFLWGVILQSLAKWAGNHDWEHAVVSLILSVILWAMFFRKLLRTAPVPAGRPARTAAWLLLGAADLLLFFSHGFFTRPLAAFLLLLAPVLFLHGKNVSGISLVPFFWSTLYIRRREELLILLSYPLRIITTRLTLFLLQILGQPVAGTDTSILVAGRPLAVTYNCSGIQQLDVFLILALLLVQTMHSRRSWQVLHFLFMVPCMVLANCLRLILTYFLYRTYGEAVLVGAVHLLLGYFQLILALIFFYALGRLFQNQASAEPEGAAA